MDDDDYTERDAHMTRDILQPFHLGKSLVRGRAARLDGVVRGVLAAHAYPREAGLLLCEALTLSALLAGMLKFSGVFTLQARGDGPVSLLVAQVTNDGFMRGYARFDEKAVVGRSRDLAGLMGQGDMMLALDQGQGGERYQGVVALEGGSLADCARGYFAKSEQVDTDFKMAVSDDGGDIRAGGIMIQRMPREGGVLVPGTDPAEDWRRVCILLQTAKPEEILSDVHSPAELAFRLFHEEDITFHPELSLAARCRCSREKVLSMLKALSAKERPEADASGRVSVTCEFCGTTYFFTKEEASS